MVYGGAPTTSYGGRYNPFRMCAAHPHRIAVIGAGIGGLTLAIALRRLGIGVDIY